MGVAMPELPALLVTKTQEAMEAARVANAERRHSRRLGGSQIGHECERATWYAFRWAYASEVFEARMLRIFETGNVYEARAVQELQAAGIAVVGTQDEISAVGGHFVAKIDGRCSRVPDAPKTEHLLEVKTHNDKSFKALLKDGVAKAKPQHMAQMQSYMAVFGLTRALYVAYNKNDDSLYIERIDYDVTLGVGLLAKAERIIRADRPPTKLHEDPASKMAFACRYCPARTVCHEGVFAERNCRTCLHATAIVDGVAGVWHCSRWDKALTPEEQQQGCGKHLYIPDLVPGEQVDSDPLAETVSYQLNDGRVFLDGGAK
jgi:hypothetical protein